MPKQKESAIRKKIDAKIKAFNLTQEPGKRIYGVKIHGSIFSASKLDSVYCVNGLYLGVEYKIPGGKVKLSQVLVVQKITECGGRAIIGDTTDGVWGIIMEVWRRGEKLRSLENTEFY